MKHKTSNRFQFKSFNERVSQINVDIVRKRKRTASTPADAESFFAESLSRWIDLDYSENFEEFKAELPMRELQTFAQLLHFKTEIADALVKHLTVPQSLCLPALFDLTLALARDLQDDFYAHFWTFFEVFMQILTRRDQDATVFDSCFTTISYLFKLLWKPLVRDVETVFRRFLPLLSHKRPYLRRFCAEAFAFLIRKLNSIAEFASFALREISEDDEAALSGLAQLFFQSMRGVRHMFHSSAPNAYENLVCLLKDETTKTERMLELLTVEMTQYTDKMNAKMMVDVVLAQIDGVAESSTIDDCKRAYARRLIQVLQVWIRFKKGALLSNTLDVLRIMSNVAPVCASDESVASVFCGAFSEIIHLRHMDIEPFQIRQHIRQVCACPSLSVAHTLTLFEELFPSPFFDSTLLQTYFDTLASLTRSLREKRRILASVAKLSLERGHLLALLNLETDIDEVISSYHSSPFRSVQNQPFDELLQFVREVLSTVSDDEEYMSSVFASLLVLPNLCSGGQVTSTGTLLRQTISRGFRAFPPLLRLVLVVDAILLLEKDVFDVVPTSVVLSFLREAPKDVSVLRLVDVYFGFARRVGEEAELRANFDEVVDLLRDNLSSPSHTVRLLTCRVLTHFEGTPTDAADVTLFRLLLQAEQVPVTLSDYREKIRLLQKLSFDGRPMRGLELIPLKFLLGQLYVNFALLWPALIDIIATHARGLPTDAFWGLFSAALTSASSSARDAQLSASQHADAPSDEREGDFLVCEWREFRRRFDAEEEADFVNYRCQLWRTLAQFVDVAEPRNRVFVTIFVDFIEHEFLNTDTLETASSQDVRSSDKSQKQEQNDDDESDRQALRPSGKNKTLLTMLAVFEKLRSPKSLYLEPKVHQIFLKLLMVPNPAIQQASLNCFFAYRWKFLTPYKENFQRILEDKTMKDELVLFSLSPEVCTINAEHRSELLPILIRILCGKLYIKPSGAGSHSLQGRRIMILRFLAGCKQSEFAFFLDLTFEHVRTRIETITTDRTLSALVHVVESKFDMSDVMPLRRMQGLLAMTDLIIKKIGESLSADHCVQLLRVIVFIGANVRVLRERKGEVAGHLLSMMRALRNLLSTCLIDFFQTVESFALSVDVVEAIFRVGVVPELNTFAEHSCYSTNGLLSLFGCFAKNPRLFPLLTFAPVDVELTPLKATISLLLNANCAQPVQFFILDMIQSLMESADFVPSVGTGERLPEELFRNVPVLATGMEDTNLGTRLLLPFMQQLLDFMERRVANTKIKLTASELSILAKLAEFVVDGKQATMLMNMLLPSLATPKPLTVQVHILTAIREMVPRVDAIDSFFEKFALLFEGLTQRTARDILCEIVKVAAERLPSSLSNDVTFFEILCKMNCWDMKRVDEPAYKVRLAAHSTFNALLADGVRDARVAAMFVRNFGFVISNVDDMSLRDSATNSLEKLVDACVKSAPAEIGIVEKHLSAIIRTGVKSKSETVRSEFVQVLRYAAKMLGTRGTSKFFGLHLLLDDEPEMDFFDNIRHIQFHRRSRALHRLCDRLDTRVGVSWQVLVPYVLPVVRPFIFDEAYTKNSGLVEESIRFVGAVARMLPWTRYRAMLDYYLQRMLKDVENQRNLVKIISTILDSFHFDVCDDGAAADAGGSVVRDAVVKLIVPKLKECLARKRPLESTHKLNAAGAVVGDDEDDAIMRVPVAITIVKLLQKISPVLLRAELPSIFLKLCSLLKSRSQDVRDSTRKTLFAIFSTIGPSYLAFFVKEIKEVLTKGYQVHVMVFTVNSLLAHMANELKAGDLDACLPALLQVAREELFGASSDEKEVAEIRRSTMEARGKKVFETFRLVGQFCSSASLFDVVKSLKEALVAKQTHKAMKCVADVLRSFAEGLARNASVGVEVAFTFVHIHIVENIGALFVEENATSADDERATGVYVILPEPGRVGAVPKVSKRSVLHVFVEFALQELISLLKRDQKADEAAMVSLLDPFVPLLLRCLECLYPKIMALSLRALTLLAKHNLPTLRTSFKQYVDRLFILLNQYAGIGSAAKGDTFELLLRIFHAVTVVVRDVEFYEISTSQLQVLLQYAEQDLLDVNRQAAAFSLLRAILSRKLISDNVHELLNRVRELAITGQAEHIRQQCRQVFLHYLTDYPLGARKIRRHVEFCVAQLVYDLEDGRVSLLELLNSIVEQFPQPTLHQHCSLLFLNLSAQLVNDESTKCRKLIALCIKNLLAKIEHNDRNNLFDISCEWMTSEQLLKRRLAAQLVGLFVEVEAEKFERRLATVLPLVVEAMKDASAVRVDVEDEERQRDGFLHEVLHSFGKICRACSPMLRGVQCQTVLNDIWECTRAGCLPHPHRLVRLAAATNFGLLFECYRPEELASNVVSSNEYLLRRNRKGEKMRELCEAFFAQLRFRPLQEDIGDEAVKNLVFLSKAVASTSDEERRALPAVDSRCETPASSSDGSVQNGESTVLVSVRRALVARTNSAGDEALSLEWFAREMSRLCRFEIVHDTKAIVKRTCAFRWFAAVSVVCSQQQLGQLVDILLRHLHREMTVPDAHETLKSMAAEVCELLKARLGVEEFTRQFALCHQNAFQRREERKKARALEAMNAPTKAALRKQKRGVAKMRARKRKIADAKYPMSGRRRAADGTGNDEGLPVESAAKRRKRVAANS